MAIDNLREREKEFLNDFYIGLTERVNEYYANKRMFTASDVIGKEDNYYYRYMAKGILLTLLGLQYLEIVGTYNGTKNYFYRCNKEIKNKDI